MENVTFESLAAAVAASFTANDNAAAQLNQARSGAYGQLAGVIGHYLADRACATVQAVKAQALQACAIIESNFTGKQPGAYKSAKSTIIAYLVAGGADMTLGKSAMSDFTNKVNKTGKYAPVKEESPEATASAPAAPVVSAEVAAVAMLDTAIAEMQAALNAAGKPAALMECFDQLLAAMGR